MARTVSASAGETTAEILVSGSADPVVVPDAAALFQGTYTRQTSDLVIEGPDGTVLRVTDYFATDETADLYSEQGAAVTADIVNRLVGAQNPMVYAQSGDIVGQDPIGQVETLEGSAFATRAGGQRVALKIGDPVFEDDLIETAGASKLGLTFIDETVFSLSANARMVLDELIYEAGGANNSMVMNLVQGTFVFITGKVAPTGDMLIETPVATVGIRGTTPIMVIDGQNGNTQFGLFEDPDGGIGAYTIFDKITGAIIRQIVNISTIVQLDRIGGDPFEVTVDAALLAERAEAQSNAYFLYAAARSRIESQQQNDGNPDGGPDNGPGDRSGLGPDEDSFDAANRLSSGLNPHPIGFPGPPPRDDPDAPPQNQNRPDLPVDMLRGSGFDPFGNGNFPPIAENLLFRFSEESTFVEGSLAASDPDGASENLTFEIVQQPQFGAVINNDDGTFSYIPDPIFNLLGPGEVASVSFDYRAIDGADAVSNTATVTLQIFGINHAPTAKPITIHSTDEDGHTFTYDLLSAAKDQDAGDDLDTANLTATSTNTSRVVLFSIDNETGKLTFDPRQFNNLADGDSETVTFDYAVTDSFGGMTNNTAQITITGKNDAPIAGNDGTNGQYKVAMAGSINILVSDLLANDSDPEGDTFDISNVFGPVNGSAVLNTGAGAHVTFTANASLSNGTVVGFDYTVTDYHGASSSASVQIIIDNMI